MKNLITLIVIGLISLSLTATSANQDRKVSPFTSIENTCSIDVTIIQGDSYSLKVIAPDKYLKKIETKVVASTLIIDVKGNINSTEDFEVIVTVVKLNEIELHGSGDAEIEGILEGESLSIVLHGSGDFEGNLNVKDLEVRLHGSGDAELSGVNGSLSVEQHGSGDFEANDLHIGNSFFSMNGSGDIQVSGTAAMMELRQSGSGDFDGRSFKIKTAKVKKSSSGEADVYVTENIDARLSGSGDLNLKGNAQATDFSVSGSGDINHL